jgi:hypothetical protein
VRRLLVTDSVVPSSPILVTLMEALDSPETSVLTRAARRNILEDDIFHSHRREYLKSYIDSSVSRLDSVKLNVMFTCHVEIRMPPAIVTCLQVNRYHLNGVPETKELQSRRLLSVTERCPVSPSFPCMTCLKQKMGGACLIWQQMFCSQRLMYAL